MKSKLSQKDFKEIKKTLEYLSDDQLTELFIETEKLYFENIDWTKINEASTQSIRVGNEQLIKHGNAFYNKNLTKFFNERKETSTYKPDFKDITNLSKHIIITLTAKDVAKIFVMMLMYQSREWASYMIFNKNLPELNDIYVNKKTTQEFKVPIDKFVVVPQKTGNVHVEFYNQEYPELMQEIVQARIKNIYTTGRIHSHHTMSAYHSSVDNNEFEKHLEIGDKYISIVVAFDKGNKFPKSEKVVTVEKYKEFFDGLAYHAKLGIPDKEKKLSKVGVIIECEVELEEITQEDIDEAYNFYAQYVDMLDYIEKTETTFKTIALMVDSKKLEPTDEFEVRSVLKENPLMLKSFSILSNITQNAIVDKKETDKAFEEFKKDYISFGQKYDIIEKPKSVVYSPQQSYSSSKSDKSNKSNGKDIGADQVTKVKAENNMTYFKLRRDMLDIQLNIQCICHFCKKHITKQIHLKFMDESISLMCDNVNCTKWMNFSFWKFKDIEDQVKKDKKDQKKN